MTARTNTKTVTFTEPFNLRGIEGELPAGDYTVETQEELIEGLSFPVYRRVLTQIHLGTVKGHPGWSQTFEIHPQDLNGALALDSAHLSPAEKKKHSHG
ncbi:hypothetical protein ACFL12_02895 [Pseudomonadota bacterium]